MECALFVLNGGSWERHSSVYADVQTLLERIGKDVFLKTLALDKKRIIFGEGAVLRKNSIPVHVLNRMIEDKVVHAEAVADQGE
jgi:hypothetical protein